VITSPATRAPHIGQANSVLGRLKRQIIRGRFPMSQHVGWVEAKR
jgi:hypothetical protein